MMAVWLILLAVGVIFVGLLVLYKSGRMDNLPTWTGFSFKSDEKVLVADEFHQGEELRHTVSHEPQPGKTLWDWLQLLIIPVVLAVVVFSFNAGQESMNQKLEQQREQEQLVDAYLDRMSNLLLAGNLYDSQPKAPVRAMAQAITLMTLERLDPDHKRIVIFFLYRADLIVYHFDYLNKEPGRLDKDKPIITLPLADLEGAKLNGLYLGSVDLHNMHLSGADLHSDWLEQADLGVSIADHVDLSNASMKAANLYNADLREANLQDTQLPEANMIGAFLTGAQLSRADLSRANLAVYTTSHGKFYTQLDNAVLDHVNLSKALLTGANLTNADLTGANLTNADLTGANLTNADLTGANLYHAKVSSAQLAEAQSLAGAILPDGTRHS